MRARADVLLAENERLRAGLEELCRMRREHGLSLVAYATARAALDEANAIRAEAMHAGYRIEEAQ